jgi:cysteine desulfurase family protein (TIGR01976 family)
METNKFDKKSAIRCRADFPSLCRKHNGHNLAYFDGPGGTQVPQVVIDAVSEYYCRCNSNTHGAFVTTQESDEILHEARTALADFLGVPGKDGWRSVSFGANMTTINFALSYAIAKHLHEGDEVVITELDHEANRGPWLNLKQYGIVVKEVKLHNTGVLDYEDLQEKVTDKTKILAIGISSNALGTVNDIAKARKISRDVGAYLVLDAVHYAPHHPLDVETLDADFLICSGYKFYGPHVGVLYSRPGLLDGLSTDALSTQESYAPFKFETGTLNHASIAGMLATVNYIASLGIGSTRREKVISAMTAIAEYEHVLAKRYFEEAKKIPGVTVWGTGFNVHRVPTVSITIDGIEPQDAARQLGDAGLCLWAGSFYAAKAIEVLGLKERGGVLRTGISLYNIDEEVDRLLNGIARIKNKITI